MYKNIKNFNKKMKSKSIDSPKLKSGLIFNYTI